MITTFGEIMLRISPSISSERVIQAKNFRIEPGGSESNVAIALSGLGQQSQFVTRLPKNELSKSVVQYLRKHEVSTQNILFGGNRIGLYWTENGTGPRKSFVIYDRENTSFSESTYEDYNWNEILKQSKWLHFSGISPAVSRSVSMLLKKITNDCSCPYSIDLNYRAKLWDWTEKKPKEICEVMTSLCGNATLIAGNESDFINIFSVDSQNKNEDIRFKEIAEKIFSKFSQAKYIAISNRKSISATLNDWNGYLFVRDDNITMYKGLNYHLDHIQDRVGTGDSFVAGIIYGLNNFNSGEYHKTIDFAVSLSALNHTTRGDASYFSKKDVFEVIKTKGSGRIVR